MFFVFFAVHDEWRSMTLVVCYTINDVNGSAVHERLKLTVIDAITIQ